MGMPGTGGGGGSGISRQHRPALAPYRSEPIWIRPSPRLGLGVPTGWEKNYFLEFAPNLKQMVTQTNDPTPGKPISKQEMLAKFFDEIGENFATCGLKKKEKTLTQQKQEMAPTVWEVRERLRELVEEHQTKIEDLMYEDSKYPLLVKGELDQKLAMKSERNKLVKMERDQKDTKYLKTAKERIKNSQKKLNDNQSDSAKTNAQVQNFYKESRNAYHRKAAPARYHVDAKFRKK